MTGGEALATCSRELLLGRKLARLSFAQAKNL